MPTAPEPVAPPFAIRPPQVVAVATSPTHEFSKQIRQVIRLVEGVGVEGDAHAGRTIQHRSRVRRGPTQPNLRQVHLIHAELFGDVRRGGHQVHPGDLGENVTTAGVDLLRLPVGSLLHLGDTAEVVVTGLRNPCYQIDGFQAGLLEHVLRRGADGSLHRLVGVMGVVRRTGEVRPGDPVTVVLPDKPHRPLDPV